ncbi:hypothetical protein Ndes2526A_g03370 [Nannochloris sp. 'desiccata']
MAGVPFVTIILSGAGKAFPTEVVDAPPDADPNVSSLCRRFSRISAVVLNWAAERLGDIGSKSEVHVA